MARNEESDEIFERDDDFFDDDDIEEEGESDEGYDETDDDEDYLDPNLKKRLEKERQSLIDQIVSEIAEEKADGQVYKGLQKVLSKRDMELRELRDTNQQLIAMMGEMRQAVSGVSEGLSWTNKALLDNLDEDVQKKLTDDLKDKSLQRLQAQVNAIQSGNQQQQYATQVDQATYQEAVRRRAEFIETQREIAETMGIDRNDPRLNFGGDDAWNAAEITAAFKESMKAIMADEKETKGVVKKKNLPTTRISEGGASGTGRMNARELIALGANQRIRSANSDFRRRRA